MSTFIEEHTFCAYCGLLVKVGTEHQCKKVDAFIPKSDYWCAWCQTNTTLVTMNGKAACGNCGHTLHGGNANINQTVVHFSGMPMFHF